MVRFFPFELEFMGSNLTACNFYLVMSFAQLLNFEIKLKFE